MGAVLTADRTGPPISERAAVVAAVVAVGLPLLGGWLARRAARGGRREANPQVARPDRLLRAGTAVLASAVVADSILEHYRGDYANRLMYAAPVAGAASLAVAVAGRGLRRTRTGLFIGAAVLGTVGLGFHVWNIMKRPGGLSWNNLFYAAPPAAPGTLIVTGACGLLLLRIERRGFPCDAREGRSVGTLAALLSAFGLLGTVAEVGLLHFRGAFHDPFMYVPVTLPPATSLAIGVALARPDGAAPRIARNMLRATAVMGLAGTGFHIYGVSRNMGGWRNWTQNVLQGPPTPAPIGFAGLALSGLAGLRLIEASDG